MGSEMAQYMAQEAAPWPLSAQEARQQMFVVGCRCC